jgi:hypothetical protein
MKVILITGGELIGPFLEVVQNDERNCIEAGGVEYPLELAEVLTFNDSDLAGLDLSRYQWNGQFLEPKPVTPPTEEEIAAQLSNYDGLIQKHVDAVARGFGYGDPNNPNISPIDRACSYADEPSIPRYQAEGRLLRAWRSAVWAAAYNMLNAVKNGQMAVPTDEAIIEALPTAPTEEQVAALMAQLTATA